MCEESATDARDGKGPISVYIQQTHLVMLLWQIFIAVSIGFVGFSITTDAKDPIETLIFVISHVIFVVSNGYPLHTEQKARISILEKLKDTESKDMFRAEGTLRITIVQTEVVLLNHFKSYRKRNQRSAAFTK